jgi:lipopolysaccharide transport system permease protein
LLLLIQWCTALGIGLVLAALNAQYRDVKHSVGFLVQLMMLASPVIYPISRLPAVVRQIAFLNPMAAVITAYRACFTAGPFDWLQIGLSCAMSAIYLVAGFWFFRQRESKLADIL